MTRFETTCAHYHLKYLWNKTWKFVRSESLPQINNEPFRLDCEERKERHYTSEKRKKERKNERKKESYNGIHQKHFVCFSGLSGIRKEGKNKERKNRTKMNQLRSRELSKGKKLRALLLEVYFYPRKYRYMSFNNKTLSKVKLPGRSTHNVVANVGLVRFFIFKSISNFMGN